MPALDGMRVLDATQYEAGPSCTQALAWLGADVVKVERPRVGDPGRGIAMGAEHSPYFLAWNSNKRSVVLDLEQASGRALLLDMLPSYDVFVENYGPGVIDRLDLGFDVMKAVHPEIIYARVKGFGTSGPYSGYKCYDMVAQAASGAFSVTGEPDGPPLRPGTTTADSGTGLQLALAITAAYVQKQREGVGQLIEISMQEAMTWFMRTMVANGSDWGQRATPRNGNGAGATVNLFPCKPFGQNDYIYIMAVTTRMWRSLCSAIGRSDLSADPRFSRGREREEHRDLLFDEISKWTRERTKAEAMKCLGEAGVPCSAVLDTRDLFHDPHLLERGFVHNVEHQALGRVPILGWPARLSASEVVIEAAPLLGEHTAEILRTDLGMSDEQIRALREQDVIGD